MPRKSDPQSVKDALTGRDIADLKESITELTKETREGFAGVHTRQDTTNGRVGKNELEIVLLKSKLSNNKVIWYMLTTTVSVVTALIVYILTKT